MPLDTRTRRSIGALRVGALCAAVLLAAVFAQPHLAAVQAAAPKCPITPNGYLDPNYTPNPPVRSHVGAGGFVLTGIVRSGIDCTPLARVRVEIWHAGPNGFYDSVHRGTVVTDANGRFRFETDFPGSSFGQPHIHIRVAVGGFKTTATAFLPKPGSKSGEIEIVLEPEV
ncbi:MAG TPA: intradiol ring-cleavage dioxygenase [bacterium]|nr:intradiol ring-cleavage dioxygenase [bacterium]